jgi:hypothetical protein
MKKVLIYLTFLISLSSCRDIIDLEFNENFPSTLVVEGYVTQGEPLSKVSLRLTVPYNQASTGAIPTDISYVLLRRKDTLGNINTDTLKEKVPGSGDYYAPENYVPAVGDEYQLEIKRNNEIFRAESKINRPAVIDSIGYFYQKETLVDLKGYQIKFAARDLPGSGEYFLFEKYKNGVFYYEQISDKVNLWDDLLTDGLTFPPPILFGLNPSPNEDRASYNKNNDYPYTLGDTVLIRVLSLDEKAYRFYGDMLGQASSSSGGPLGPLFAAPQDNVRSNVYNVNKDGSPVVGLFSARGLNMAGIRIK